jgi:hypothetical protein
MVDIMQSGHHNSRIREVAVESRLRVGCRWNEIRTKSESQKDKGGKEKGRSTVAETQLQFQRPLVVLVRRVYKDPLPPLCRLTRI